MNAAVKPYLPALGLVAAAVLSFLVVAFGDDRLDQGEIIGLGLVLANAVATYIVPRAEGATWLKPATSVVIAALTAVTSAVTDGMTTSEWFIVGLAVLGALGVVGTTKNVPVTEGAGGKRLA